MVKRVQGPEGLQIDFPDDTDAETINRVMTEAYAKRTAAATVSKPTPEIQTAPTELSGLQKFGRGLKEVSEIPGEIIRGEFGTVADKAKTVRKGQLQAFEAVGRGILSPAGNLDDVAIAGISEAADAVTGRDTGTFKDKVGRSIARGKQLETENPLSSLAGQAYGLGRAGQGLRTGVKKATGKTLGIAGEAAALAGGQTLLEGESLGNAAINAGLGGILGKGTEKVLGVVAAPISKIVASKTSKALKGGEISEEAIRALANRTKQSADDIRAAVNVFKEQNGYSPSLAEIADPETIAKFAQMSRERSGVAQVFRTAEEEAAMARPARMEAGIAATGERVPGAAVQAAAKTEVQGARQAAASELDEAKLAVKDQWRRDVDMVDAETKKLIAAENTKIGQTGEALRQDILAKTKVPDDMATVDAIEASIDDWANTIMRAPKTGLENARIVIPTKVLQREIPDRAMGDVLQAMFKATPTNTGKAKRLGVAIRALDAGRPVKLTVGDMDAIRRAFSQMTDNAGVKIDLSKASKSLTKVAEKQVPEYSNFVRKYKELKDAQEGFVKGKAIMSTGPQGFAVDVGNMNARSRGGAATGVLAKIADTIGVAPAPLKTAEKLLARGDAIVAALGKRQGDALLKTADDALNDVALMTDEIAQIKEAAANTKQGMTKEANDRVRALRKESGERIAKLRKDFKRNSTALNAADDILNQRNTAFDVAVAGADETVPLGAVARNAIADEAGQSALNAVNVADRLADTATQSRVAKVAGQETADRLAAIGTSQRTARENLSTAAARGPNDRPLSPELSAVIDVAATMTGRVGGGFVANNLRRMLVRASRLNLSNKQAQALATAVTRNDPAVLDEVITKLETTQRTRAQIEAALGKAAAVIGVVGPVSRNNAEETNAAITDLVANGYTRDEATAVVNDTNAQLTRR